MLVCGDTNLIVWNFALQLKKLTFPKRKMISRTWWKWYLKWNKLDVFQPDTSFPFEMYLRLCRQGCRSETRSPKISASRRKMSLFILILIKMSLFVNMWWSMSELIVAVRCSQKYFYTARVVGNLWWLQAENKILWNNPHFPFPSWDPRGSKRVLSLQK